jgi:hypothetical protein
MRRNDDPTLEIKGFAERVLPKANCFRMLTDDSLVSLTEVEN